MTNTLKHLNDYADLLIKDMKVQQSREVLYTIIKQKSLDAAYEQYLIASTALREAMDMQEKRETGEFHLTVTAARAIWDKAKDEYVEALTDLKKALEL